MKTISLIGVAALCTFGAPSLHATGLATCESGDPKTWKSTKALTSQLVTKGWKVNRVKVDGGCYEVYAIDEKGKRVEAYFHPQTLEPVPTKAR